MHEASHAVCELSDSGRRAQYRAKIFRRRRAQYRAKIFRDRLSMFTLFSVTLANSANFINEIADFLRVLCVDKSYQALNNT